MDNVEALLNNIYYPMDPIYNSAYDGAYTMEGIQNIYYLVYDDKEEIKYATLGIIFSLATLSSLLFFSICCSSDSERQPVQYKSLKKRKVQGTQGTQGTNGTEEIDIKDENSKNKKKDTIEYC